MIAESVGKEGERRSHNEYLSDENKYFYRIFFAVICTSRAIEMRDIFQRVHRLGNVGYPEGNFHKQKVKQDKFVESSGGEKASFVCCD